MNRRQFISMTAKTGIMAATVSPVAQTLPQVSPPSLGITIASYMQRWRKRGTPDSGTPPWNNALDILNHCKTLGAGCLQIGVKHWTRDFAGKIRDKRENLGIHLEGQISLPWKTGDVERFEKELQAAKEAGATVLRAVCLSGRRYENFHNLEEWSQFKVDSLTALQRAEPILARHKMVLGFENHKDWRAKEQVAILKKLDSEFIGATFDFGNNYSLLENPYEVAEALAPYVVTTHMKDMALAEYEEGFLLSEVPMGTGILDLHQLMTICRKGNPKVWFNLEMITRDPLKVPVLSDNYWKTLDFIDAPDLARTLAHAKKGRAHALPHISGKTWPQQMSLEEQHIRESFTYAKSRLGLK